MSDVWDLTDKDEGDHVLLALTPDECVQLLATIRDSRDWHQDDESIRSIHEEIRLSLRDQKDIEV